jgi:hypothetical protein
VKENKEYFGILGIHKILKMKSSKLINYSTNMW